MKICVRPETQDALVYESVYMKNEYRLPDSFEEGDLIIDVGANIGVFAKMCLERGAGEVWCYEPNRENFELLKKNVGDDPRAKLHRAAVWRSDKDECVRVVDMTKDPRGKPGLTAMHLVSDTGEYVPTFKLDDILVDAWDDGFSIRMLKLDCEGSEYPILYTSDSLKLAREIVGEAHLLWQYDGFNWPTSLEGILGCLRHKGFEATGHKDNHSPPINAWFFAKRAA